MIAYLDGKIAQLNPTFCVIDCGGIGYFVNISLNTFSRIEGKEKCRLFTHYHVTADAHSLFGFADQLEKELFIQLISISGIGPSTGRMILSSYNPAEIRDAIASGNVALIKSIKGIGPKSAQRIILELRDKMLKTTSMTEESVSTGNRKKEEALSALLMLGFGRSAAEKAVNEVIKVEAETATVEIIIKKALKIL